MAIVLPGGAEEIHHLAGRDPFDILVQHRFREIFPKVEDARIPPLVFADGLVIQEEVHHVPRGFLQPAGEFIRG